MPDRRRRLGILAAALGVSLCFQVAGLALLEAWLRHSARFANYFELNGLPDPGHRVERLSQPYLHVYWPNRHTTIRKTEFTIELAVNSEGLVGPDVPVAKATGEFRVITIGDSFTEGVGATADASYPAVLGSMLATRPGPMRYTVMNAGVSGSDPVYEIELLRRKLLKYQPDFVVLAINNSDVNDLQSRGGFDRFGPDGQLKSRPLPWWTWLFDHSHLVRGWVLGVLRYDWNLRSPAEAAVSTHQAVQDLVQAGVTAGQLAAAQGFRVLIVVHPDWREVQNGTLDPGLAAVVDGFKRAGVDHADLLPFFEAAIPRPVPPGYYWPKDSHYTAKGYAVFARAVYAEIERRLKVTRHAHSLPPASLPPASLPAAGRPWAGRFPRAGSTRTGAPTAGP